MPAPSRPTFSRLAEAIATLVASAHVHQIVYLSLSRNRPYGCEKDTSTTATIDGLVALTLLLDHTIALSITVVLCSILERHACPFHFIILAPPATSIFIFAPHPQHRALALQLVPLKTTSRYPSYTMATVVPPRFPRSGRPETIFSATTIQLYTPLVSPMPLPKESPSRESHCSPSPEKPAIVQLYKSPSGDSATTLVNPPAAELKQAVSISSSVRPPSAWPSLSLSSSTATTLDGDAPTKATKELKAASKAAKRNARREINRAKRKAVAEASVHQPKAIQPWEIALGQFGYEEEANTPLGPSLPFVVPAEERQSGNGGAPVPKQTYTLRHQGAVAAVERLVSAHGSWSITFSDPSYRIFLARDLDIAISFKVVHGFMRKVAVAFGDPVCHPARLPSAIAEFKAFCRQKGYGMAFVGARDAVARVADTHGWASIQFAVEQMVSPQTNPVLDGTRGKRQALVVKNLAKDAPVHVYSRADGEFDEHLEAQLQTAYEAVYAAKEDRDGAPYSTKLSLFALRKLMTVLYTTDSCGVPNGLVGLMRVGVGKYLLDPLVAVQSAPPGTTDYLSVLAMGWLRRRGATHMSFGTEPTPTVGEIRGMPKFMEMDARLIHAATYIAFGMGGKKTFHDKFHPDDGRGENLYLILSSRGVLGQSCCAAAIWRATHLKSGPVVQPLLRLVAQQKTGAQLEALLGFLNQQRHITPSSIDLSTEDDSGRLPDDTPSDKTLAESFVLSAALTDT